MIHTLSTVAACDEVEERLYIALADAIRDHSPALARYYRSEIREVEAARETLADE